MNDKATVHTKQCSVFITADQVIYISFQSFDEDHTRALNAGIDDPLKEWRRPRGHPRQTWLHTVENYLKRQNLRLWSAPYRAYDREQWRDIMETATLLQGYAT